MNNMNATIFVLAIVAVTFVTSYPCYTPEESCIIKNRKGTRNDVLADELKVEEPALSYRGRMLTVIVKPVHRCQYGLCKSRRGAQVGVTSRHGPLVNCIYCRRTSKFTCKSHRRNVEIRVVWDKHKTQLSIRGVNRVVSIKAVMPTVGYQRLSFSRLQYCLLPKCKIVITEKIQGCTCPMKRKRFPIGSTQDLTIRTLDGRLNNPIDIFNGAVGENLRRLSKSRFADGVYVPAGACSKEQRKSNTCPFPKENNGTGSNRPSPRLISNTLLRQNRNIYSCRGLSDLAVFFGQFLSHDTVLSASLPESFESKRPNDVELDYAVPKGDVIFDFDSKGNKTLGVRRFNFDGCTGEEHNTPRQITATLAAVLDGSTIYGHEEKRLKLLRAYKDGLMKTDERNFLPLKPVNLTMANAIARDPSRLRAAGDIRANQSPILLVLQTLFVREHNRIARAYRRKHRRANDEEIFQYARKIVIAEIQAIAYREYIPSILGHQLPKYRGYDPMINTAVATEFNEATFRFGHSQVNSKVFRFDEDGEVSPYGHVLLREGFFHPERVTEEGGLEPILRGAVRQRSQEIDTKVVDELRNFLFPSNGIGDDLPAVNIERGRDAGLPDYVSIRKKFKLGKIKSFDQITNDRKVAKTLKSLYKRVENLDLYVGGLAEDHRRGSELGPTFHKIFMDQWKRIRDGDRFWYTRVLSKKEIKQVHKNTLSRIIRLNTKFKNPPENVFFSTDFCRDVENYQCIRR